MNSKEELFKQYSFPGQRTGEVIKLIVRRHNFILLPYLGSLFTMAILPVIFYAVAVPNLFTAFYAYPYDRILILASLIYYGFIWIVGFIIWTDYYLDIWIVTDQRLIDVEQVGFFSRVVSELDLKRIQDITSEVSGMAETMLGFGNVFIQTASEDKKFHLTSIPHPVETRRTIVNLYEAAREKDRFVFKERDE